MLIPGTDSVWMAHPFSGVPTDFVVTINGRRWFANCVWDGLAILAQSSEDVFALGASGGGGFYCGFGGGVGCLAGGAGMPMRLFATRPE
mgnify:CR=1 FL=1